MRPVCPATFSTSRDRRRTACPHIRHDQESGDSDSSADRSALHPALSAAPQRCRRALGGSGRPANPPSVRSVSGAAADNGADTADQASAMIGASDRNARRSSLIHVHGALSQGRQIAMSVTPSTRTTSISHQRASLYSGFQPPYLFLFRCGESSYNVTLCNARCRSSILPKLALWGSEIDSGGDLLFRSCAGW